MLSKMIVFLRGKGTIGRWVVLTTILLFFAGAQNISAKTKPYIVGGNEVNPPFKYTWMTALIYSTADSTGDVIDYQFCGGTLIQSKIVVTAAHCFFDLDSGSITYGQPIIKAKDVDVLLGAHDLTVGNENTLRQRIKVLQLKIHEKYNFWTDENDIALLKLKSPVQRLSAAALISKPSLKDPGTTATTIGWGHTGIDYSEILLEVDLPVVSQTTCENAMGDGRITDNMLCAGYEQGGKSNCFGDSGGPLVVQNPSQNNRWELTGIVSWGEDPCAAAGQYTVYTNVYNYLDWIERHRSSFTPGLPGVQLLLLGN